MRCPCLSQPMTQTNAQPEWMDYRDAAKLMHCPASSLVRRWADGSFRYHPEIKRWQPGGRGTRLYVRRADVEAWIERSRQSATAPIKREFNAGTYQSVVPTLQKTRGGQYLINKLGLK